MIVVYKQTDRIQLSIHDVTFSLKPLSVFEQSKCSEALRNEAGTQQENINKTVYYLIKYMVKGVTGIEYIDGTPMQLEFSEDDSLSDATISEFVAMEITSDLQTSLVGFISGIPTEFNQDYISIKPIKGMEVKKKQTSTTSG